MRSAPPAAPDAASARARVKGVLLDLDGTFADTAPDLGAALNHVLGLHGRAPLPLDTVRTQASHGARGLLKLGFGIEPEDPGFEALRAEFLGYYDRHICVHTRLFSGMAELIDRLEQAPVPWAIVTNKPHRFTAPLMEALGYARRAATLVSGDTCARAKPHPDPLLKACETMGVEARDCLYLGDDLRDMLAARAAHMPGIVAGWGYIGEDAGRWPARGRADTPLDLLAYLG